MPQSRRWTRRTARFCKESTGPESSEDEFGILVDDRCIDTGVFQQRYLVHELVFACSPSPPLRPRVSHTILTEADWCSTRAVARSPNHPDRGHRFASVLALTRNQDTVNKYARMIKVSRHNTFLNHPAAVSLKHGTRTQWTIVRPWKRKRSWTADALCRLESSLTSQYDSELGLGLPEALIPRDEESSFFPTGHACRRIFCADQIGFACEEFQRQNA